MPVLAAKLTSEDLVAVNRIFWKLGYQTLGSFLRDIIREELTLIKGKVNPDILERLTSIEQKVNLLMGSGEGRNEVSVNAFNAEGSQRVRWAEQDLNLRLLPCKGSVLTELSEPRGHSMATFSRRSAHDFSCDSR